MEGLIINKKEEVVGRLVDEKNKIVLKTEDLSLKETFQRYPVVEKKHISEEGVIVDAAITLKPTEKERYMKWAGDMLLSLGFKLYIS